MKQTAVEFAVKQLEQLIPFGHQLAIRIILEQAKEIERQQIINSRITAPSEVVSYSEIISIKEAKEYYNEQFKNK